MNKYLVHGADNKTGQSAAKVYDAASAQDAEYFANQDGILVSRVEMVAAANPETQILVSSQKAQQTTTDLLIGWICFLFIPFFGLFIAWYLFDAAVKRGGGDGAKISLTIVRVIALLLFALAAMAFLAGLFSVI